MITSQRLKAARALAGLTQEELARAAGVAEITIKGIEQGKVVDPRQSTVSKLVGAFRNLGVEFTENGVEKLQHKQEGK